jgi:glycosyltransferase involved in cell wall biosynthesis
MRDSNNLRVLISGPLPPPVGGMGVYYQSLLSTSLCKRVNLCFVQTSSSKRMLSETGRLTIKNMVAAFMDCGRFAISVLIHRPEIAHIATTFDLSFVKHSICVGIARLLGSRVLLHPHCSLSVLYGERPDWWRWFFLRIVRFTSGVIALSSEWLQLGRILPGCHVYFLPNGIALTPYRAIAGEKMTAGKKNGSLNILYLGYLGRAKGSFDLINAAKEIRAKGVIAVFDLVGDELTRGEKAQLREEIAGAEPNGHLKLHPAAFGSEKITLFRNADIFVYPSYHEGMPLGVLEAMACGLPIVATRVGGLVDLVKDGVNGILVDPGRPDQIAAAIHKLAVNMDLLHAMGRRSYELVSEKYDLEQRVGQLVDIYKKVLYRK